MNKARILIVEDEPHTAQHFSLRLEAIGHDVIGICSSAEQAVEAAINDPPDILFMDVHLGTKMDGIDAAGMILKQRYIPIILVTANISEDILNRIGSLDLCGFMSKPPKDNELMAMIRVAMANAKRRNMDTENKNQVRVQLMSLAESNVTMALLNSFIERLRENEKEHLDKGSITDFYQDVIDNLVNITNAKYGAILLLDGHGNASKLVTSGMTDMQKHAIEGTLQGKGVLATVMDSELPVRVDNIAAHPNSVGFPPGHPSMTSLVGVSIRVGDRVRGNIYLTDKHGGKPFSQNDDVMLSLASVELGHMLERHEMMEKMQLQQEKLLAEKTEQQKLIRQLEDAQQKVLQSEKLASIGQLAAGVAHEINNPVGYISSNISTLKSYIDDAYALIDAYAAAYDGDNTSVEMRNNLETMKKSVDLEYLRTDTTCLISESLEGVNRVKQIVQDLKDFSHVDEGEWGWSDLHRGIDSTLNIVHNEIKYKANVVKLYGELPQIECQISQLNQVFMNLLVNAAHAIVGHGTITVETGSNDEHSVWVKVSDTGAGITPENLKRIFDPFFTTKPIGKGTGLGLSLTYGIIKKHNGSIEVDSEPGKGTAFRITLPVSQGLDEKGERIASNAATQ